eukprot:340338_1
MFSFSLLWIVSSFHIICNGKKPNILFLQVDEMDGRNMDPTVPSQYNVISMPNLRNMAKNGVQFIRTYTNSPQCVAARTALWSGRRNNDIHVYNNAMGFAMSSDGKTVDDSCIKCYNQDTCQSVGKYQALNFTMFDAMESLGYNVYIDGKLHIGAAIKQTKQGKDATQNPFEPATDSNSMASITRSINILKPQSGSNPTNVNNNSTNPHSKDVEIIGTCIDSLNDLGSKRTNGNDEQWMLYCSINIPHGPYETNQTYLNKVNINNITIPIWKNEDTQTQILECPSVKRRQKKK